MNVELITKDDLESAKREIIDTIKAMLNQDSNRPYTFDEACKYLGMKPQTLRQKCSSGEVAYSKAGGVKFLKKDLDSYIMERRIKSNAEILAIANRI